MGDYEAVPRQRPAGLSDSDVILTHEYTRGWGSCCHKRKVADIDWSLVFGIRRAPITQTPLAQTDNRG